MKAVLHYRAGPNFRAMAEALRGTLDVAIVEPGDADGMAREMADAEVLLHVLAPVTAEVMDLAPKLRLVQKIGVGIDAIDRAHAKARGVAVCNMPGTNTAAVTEMTLALMLACLRRIPVLHAGTAAGDIWPRAGEIGDGLGEIGGRTVGLVGYGAVAQRLAPVLRALGAEVIAHSRTARGDGVEFVGLDDLLARADIVSLHLPANAETQNLLDGRRLALMKPGAILINTARGSLVDETALANALSSGRLGAAGLDVFAAEPPPSANPLLGLPNVVLAPHLAWLTQETLRRSLEIVAENVRRLQAGEALLHRVA